jgi:nucleoside-diphosphate-sugar epimerase
MTALVTGATGFIGSFLVERLVARGDRMRCLVLETDELEPLRQWPVEICYGDLCRPETLKDAVRGVEHIYHLAGAKTGWDEAIFFRINYEGTKNLAEACLSQNRTINRFVFASSQAAAGPSRDGHPLREEEKCSPRTAYGRSKRAAEECLQAHTHELPITILRLALVYGPRNLTTVRGLRMARRRLIPKVDQYFNAIYVQDVVEAMILAAEQEQARGQIYFITSPESVTLQEIVQQALTIQHKKGLAIPIPGRLFGLFVRLQWVYQTLVNRPSQPLNILHELTDLLQKYWVCSGEKANRELGFEPKISLREGIQRTLQWYNESSPDQEMSR